MSKMLFIDVETRPNTALVWRYFKENISPKQVLASSTIMSFAAKWQGSEDIFYMADDTNTEKKLLEALLSLLDEADIVVGHYSSRFDIPRIRARAMALGLKPPSPFKQVDTKMVASKEFSFEGNSLEYLAKVLGCSPKLSHKKFPGFELWLECMRGNKEAYEELRTYNIQDVLTTEELYNKMLPWITNHPNVAVGEDHKCPKCGGVHLQKRGYYKTDVRTYQRYQCQGCGGWSRARLMDKETRSSSIVNAV